MKLIAPMTDVDKVLFYALVSMCPTSKFTGIKQVGHDGKPDVLVGYDCWTFNSVEMHCWVRSPRAINRLTIQEVFRYPFNQVGVGIAIGITPCNNAPALELNRRLGFRRVLTIKDGYAIGTDLAIQELRKEECRWLEMKVPNGRQSEHSPCT